MAAAIAKVPELEIEEKEAATIAKAVQRLNEMYGGMVLPEKQAAWLQLGIACGTVYGPRIVANRMRVRSEKTDGKTEPRKRAPVTIDAETVIN